MFKKETAGFKFCSKKINQHPANKKETSARRIKQATSWTEWESPGEKGDWKGRQQGFREPTKATSTKTGGFSVSETGQDIQPSAGQREDPIRVSGLPRAAGSDGQHPEDVFRRDLCRFRGTAKHMVAKNLVIFD